MIIEKGVAADIDGIGQFYEDVIDFLEAHENFPGWKKGIYPAREDAESGVSDGALFVARDGERIAGSFILRHEPEPGYAKASWKAAPDFEHDFVIYTLAVHPDYFGSGLSTEIIDFISRYGKENGAHSICLGVYYKNLPAIKLYRKSGFEYIDTLDLGYSEYGLEKFELYQKIL